MLRKALKRMRPPMPKTQGLERRSQRGGIVGEGGWEAVFEGGVWWIGNLALSEDVFSALWVMGFFLAGKVGGNCGWMNGLGF